MYKGKYIYAQLVSLVPKYQFYKCVKRYNGNYKVKEFKCWQQFLYMMFGQLTYREGVRDIVNCLEAHSNKVYHIGINKVVSHSTLTRANEHRCWKIWAGFANYLIEIARPLYLDDNDFDIDLDNTVYALDASTIDLCLSVFQWAQFRKTKAAIKLHTLLDVRGNIPTFIAITDGKVNDVNILDHIQFEAGAFYLIDRGYYDFKRLYKINSDKSFFVIRAKNNIQFKRLYSRKVDKETGLRCDQIIKLTIYKSAKAYPEKLRRIKFYDKTENIIYVFLTNNFQVDALSIALLYKYRWKIELFFKWIKQHLKIKVFWGHSPNTVKTQIWIAVCTYLLVAIAKKKINSSLSLYEILQILSVSAFDKTPINQLLTKSDLQKTNTMPHNQLTLFDL